MPLKNNWVNGDIVNGSDLNAVADQVNSNTTAIGSGTLPSQSGQAGKFLGTNGTTSSWGPVVAPETHAAAAKATPIDADEFAVVDTAAANVIKKTTLANLKTNLVTSATVDGAGAVMNSDTSTAAMLFVIGENNMVSNSAVKVPTQQSVKAYVDANAGSGGGGGGLTLTDNADGTGSTTGGSVVDNGDGTASASSSAGSGSQLYVNVKDYGALGNGVADDTTEIQAAIAAAVAAGGGTVYFPPGTFEINATLVINADNVRLLGSGYATVIQAGGGFPNSTSMIQVQAPGGSNFRQGLVIEQLKIDGNNKTGVTGVELISTYHAQLQHIWIQHCIGKGLYLNGTPTAYGAYTNITSVQITDGGAGKGVDTDRHEHCIFTGCVFAWHEQTGGIGVRSQSSNMVFQGCKFDVNDISLDMEFCIANVIEGCDFDRGITNHLFMNGAQQTRLTGNQFSNRYLSSGVDMISVGNSGNLSNIFVANVALPSSGFTTFIRELSGTGPGNQYIGNDTGGLAYVLQRPNAWLNSNGPRVTTITSSATPAINTDLCDAVTITALAAAITSMTTNLSGTPANFQKLTIRIKDNGTLRAITWGASFEAGSAALPTTTVAGKTLLVELFYDSVDAKWACERTASRP